jgi:hypothetical protein
MYWPNINFSCPKKSPFFAPSFIFTRNSTMSLTTLVICFFYLSNMLWDHKYVFHLNRVFYHLVQVILNLFASMFLTSRPNLSNLHTSSHVPWEMSHMASLVYYKIWDFCIFFSYCTVFSSSSKMFYSKCPKCHSRFFLFCLILFVSTVWKSLYFQVSHFFLTVPIP